MNSKSLRRLATEHANLHSQPLPPNYLFAPQSNDSDDLTSLDILLAGPEHTPFAAGVWRLHLSIPPNYPEHPPTAHFYTPIFHPNVDPQTGGVCVETLKRDWDSKLTLRDVLVTISCLLIQPNPDSALNAEAGALIQEGYESFDKRARLMTSIQAKVRGDLRDVVREAQRRGQEREEESEDEDVSSRGPVRQRRMTRRLRGTVAARRSNGSPSEVPARNRQQAVARHATNRPFVFQRGNDDVFGFGRIPTPRDSFDEQERSQRSAEWDDSTMMDADQENDETRSSSKPVMASPSKVATPRRPHATPVPLGELTVEEEFDEDISEDMEPEYPPSPKKSPSKSPMKQQPRRLLFDTRDRGEASRNVLFDTPNITPPNAMDTPLAADSELSISIQPSPSPHKLRMQQRNAFDGHSIRKQGGGLFGSHGTGSGIVRRKSPQARDMHDEKAMRAAELDAKLWRSCGGDLGRWNRGDFDGDVFKKTAGRW
ncbi:UBC-like protein [Polychaeton citri CBS 116435]|uniref:Ubiquitin-conjugating enzyme E2 2 n=1 Tax=Polychaeton citri CBS 116435 TaxID=1314669 RepID=A0A9P4Q922_9PEZI|nr:UBC-like protein [Polychaeton citri CBS 116435]